MLTRGLAVALAPRIQVNAVAPGVVLLPEGFPRESGRRLAARIPMGRHGRPADVAEAVRFFATCSDYVTGQVLFVDGGMSARFETTRTALDEEPEGARADLDVERGVGARARRRAGRAAARPRPPAPGPRAGARSADWRGGRPSTPWGASAPARAGRARPAGPRRGGRRRGARPARSACRHRTRRRCTPPRSPRGRSRVGIVQAHRHLGGPVVAQARQHRARVDQPPAARAGALRHHRVESRAGRVRGSSGDRPATGRARVQGDDAALDQAARGAPGIARQPQVAAGIAPAAGHERADGHRMLRRAAAARPLTTSFRVPSPPTATTSGTPARAASAASVAAWPRARVSTISKAKRWRVRHVAERRPEAPGAAAAGRGVDDEEGGCGYVRPTRPPPMARMKSLMDGKRIIGFSRFSAPMVVCEPP